MNRNPRVRGASRLRSTMIVAGLCLLTLGGGAYAQATVNVSNWLQQLPQPFAGRDSAGACLYNGKMWLIGGSTGSSHLNDVWSSPDGVNWSQVTAGAAFSRRVWHMVLEFQGKLWLIGGYNGPSQTYLNDIWYSTDGAQWTQATAAAEFAPRTQFTCVVYNNKIWLMGGWNGISAFSDVWSTDNGVNWTRVTEAAGFGSRSEHRSIVFNGRMWVIGGQVGSGTAPSTLNDAWWSTDGQSWTQATAAAGFSPRLGHELVAVGPELFLIGGCGGPEGQNLKNDIWSTTDGANWSPVTAGAQFSPRYMARALNYAGHFWLLGGRIGTAYQVAGDALWRTADLVPVELSGFSVE